MASYKCATVLVIAICLCFFHLSSSLDTIIKGKKECPQEIHNTTDDLSRVLKGGGGISGGARSFSGGARSFSGGSHGYSSETGGYSSSSTAIAAASASAGSNRHHHSNNSSVICMSSVLAISFLAVVLSSFAMHFEQIVIGVM